MPPKTSVGAATPKTAAQTITLVVNEDVLGTLDSAFPEIGGAKAAQGLAEMMFGEIVGLFAGKKRYLSLSHQYIEWIQEIHEALLPAEEYTYDRLFNRFQFPPGTAAYMARVLRGRQNTDLNGRAVTGLRAKLADALATYKANDRPGAGRVSIRLTLREYAILIATIDKLLERDAKAAIESPQPESGRGSKMFVGLAIDARQLPSIIDGIDQQYPNVK